MIISYEIEFAENGVILRPENAPTTVHTENEIPKEGNDSFCMALGEEIYYSLLRKMEKEGTYKFELSIEVKEITEQ